MCTPIAVGVLLTLPIAGCGSRSQPAADLSSGAATATTTSAATAGPSKTWIMPNLVGSNLQAAQDSIQALTGNQIFLTKSHDATGAGRSQVLDRNWKVCTQNIPAGSKIDASSSIDFGAAKLEEACP